MRSMSHTNPNILLIPEAEDGTVGFIKSWINNKHDVYQAAVPYTVFYFPPLNLAKALVFPVLWLGATHS